MIIRLMKSHTVPKKLLEQFAYFDRKTNSLRLWRYQKGRKPFWKASPETATVVEGVFADPRDAEKEAELEHRLNREFEEPVHEFIQQAGYRTFVPSRAHIIKLTAYVSLLFHRSKARRAATQQQVDVIVESCRSLLGNEEQLRRIAAKWTLDMIDGGHSLGRGVTIDDVRKAVQEMIDDQLAADQFQHTYSGTMERAMSRFDEQMLNGNWNLLHTSTDNPFVIGDAPVVTWERTDGNVMIYGQGFSRPNVEIFLPISPIACLHIQPAVQRTRRVHAPTAQEVNMAEASYASEYCYTNVYSEALDAILQPQFGRTTLGVNAFSIRHRDFRNTMFEILMNRGRWVDPPRLV